jgi:uncharacterized membrane protein
MSTARLARAGLSRAAIALTMGTLLLGLLVPTAAADDGLEVTTPFPAVAVAPGSKVTFDLTVTSTRSGNAGLSLDGVPSGWAASLHGGGFVVDGVSVSPGKDATVRLDVTVPGDAAASTQTIRVNASQAGARDVLPIAIRVNEAAAGDITLTTTTPTLTGASDATFPFTLTLKNDTAQDVTVSVTATGEPGWDVKAEITGKEQAAATVVEAGSTASLQITATPPDNAPAGKYPIHVEATAGDRTIPADLEVDVTGSFSMKLSTPGDLLSAHGSAGSATQQQFIVTNDGTADLKAVTVTAQPPSGWDVKFDPPSIDVAPEKTGTITATITPSSEAVAGDYVVAFTAATSSDEGTNATAQVRFTVETSPIWAIVGIAIIVAIMGFLFYVFRTYGRR